METTEATRDSKAVAVRFRWLIIAGITFAILACPVLVQVIQVRHIERVASAISVGDSRAQVVKLLGKPRVTYSTGFPARGGAATVWGSYYGGWFNSLCQRLGAHSFVDWPISIEFDKDGTVTAIRK